MQSVYKNIDEYNTDKEHKILIVFDDMNADMINNKKLNSIITQQIALNHSSDINSKDFIKIYKKCIAEPYSFLANDATLASDDPFKI